MVTTSFTTRIDSDLKKRLEKIARYEDRSASYMASQAIRALVEEREQTHELIKTGLALMDQGQSISHKSVEDWLRAPAEAAFPKPDTFD